MPSNSQKRIRRIREATKGTTPAGNMLELPFETFTMSSGIEREQPGNVAANRQIVDNPATNVTPTASATSDYQYSDYEGLWEEVWCGAKTAAVSTITGTTFACVDSTNRVTDSGNGLAGVAAGRFVLVNGFTESANAGPRLGRVTDSAAGYITIDTNFWNVADETAGDTVSIYIGGYFSLGTSMLTATYEEWNTASSVGRVMRGVGCSQYSVSGTSPNKFTQSFSFVGMSAAGILASALANATDAATAPPIINANSNFGETDDTDVGMGLRWNGTLIPTVRVKTYRCTWANPLLAEGQLGTLGPTTIQLDGRFDIRIELEIFRDGAVATESFITDANTQSTTKSLGIGWKDNDGNRIYDWFPEVQPFGETPNGLAQSGSDMTTITLVARSAATYGMFRRTVFASF